MFVRDFVDVEMPLAAVTTQVADPELWARALDGRITEQDRSLIARFGLDGVFPFVGKLVEIRVGEPRQQGRGTVIDIEWQPAGTDGPRTWFPVMHADLSLAALAAASTHVEFNGSYIPPG